MLSKHPRIALVAAVFVSLVGVAQPARATGQEDASRTAWVLGLGIKSDSVRDDLLLPLTFYGPGLGLFAGYRGELGPGILTCLGDFGAAYLHDRFGHGGLGIEYGVEVLWTTKVVRALDWHASAGIAFALDSRIHYLFSWDNARAYWLGAEYIGPALRYVGRLHRGWRLESTASLSLVGLLGRPPEDRHQKQEAVSQVGYYFEKPFGSQRAVGPLGLQVARLLVALVPPGERDGEVARGWSYGVEVRFAHTDLPATYLDLEATVYAARAWGF